MKEVKKYLDSYSMEIIERAKRIRFKPETYGSIYDMENPLDQVYYKDEIYFKGIPEPIKVSELEIYEILQKKIKACSYGHALRLGTLYQLIFMGKFIEYDSDFTIEFFNEKVITNIHPYVIDNINGEHVYPSQLSDSFTDNNRKVITNFSTYVNDFISNNYEIIGGVYVDKKCFTLLEKDQMEHLSKSDVPVIDQQKISDRVRAFLSGCCADRGGNDYVGKKTMKKIF